MAIHPRLEGEFWGPTIDLLLDENIKVVFTCFNKDHYDEMLDRLDYVFVKYIYKVNIFSWDTFNIDLLIIHFIFCCQSQLIRLNGLLLLLSPRPSCKNLQPPQQMYWVLPKFQILCTMEQWVFLIISLS